MEPPARNKTEGTLVRKENKSLKSTLTPCGLRTVTLNAILLAKIKESFYENHHCLYFSFDLYCRLRT